MSIGHLEEPCQNSNNNQCIHNIHNILYCMIKEKPEYYIESYKGELAKMFSPKHINWRYDPIIISSMTDYNFHLKNFEQIASSLQGHVERCYFSYAIQYGKVKRNFDKFMMEYHIDILDPDIDFKIDLVNHLTEIAGNYGISMYTCCGDFLISKDVKKAHCIDGGIIEELFLQNKLEYVEKPTRKECGCAESIDIGTYDTCPHGCIYCYANLNKTRANRSFQRHDTKSAYLGYSKELADKWINMDK